MEQPVMNLEEFVMRLRKWFEIRGQTMPEYKEVSDRLYADILHSKLFYKIFVQNKVSELKPPSS